MTPRATSSRNVQLSLDARGWLNILLPEPPAIATFIIVSKMVKETVQQTIGQGLGNEIHEPLVGAFCGMLE